MSLQISPFGVIIASPFYLLAYLLLLRLWRKLRTSPMRWGILALTPIVLALPFADEFWIAWRFREACRDAGVHVARQVEVDGYFNATTSGIDTPGPISSPQAIAAYEDGRYRFYERLIGYDPSAVPLRVSHVEKIDGKWLVSILSKPAARYHYRFTDSRQDVPIGYQLWKFETEVIDSTSGDAIGRNTMVKRRASMIERLWIRQVGSDLTICPDPEKGPRQPPFPETVLVPAVNK
jgi:hypothetical protein